jgi:lysyl-tRNA synthetase class 2
MEPTLYATAAGGGYLRTSPEFALKRVMAAGLPRVYEVAPCFREREHSPWHAHEFLMLEWYRAGATLSDLMDEVEALAASVADAIGRPAPGPWHRTTIRDLFLTHVGVDLATASAAEISPDDPDDWDAAFFRRWVADIEPKLDGAWFVSEWPASQAALAKVREHRAWPVACRFEVYIDGVELGNAFLELIDATEQTRRAHEAQQHQEAAGDAPHPIDHAFLTAVGQLPPCAGIAVGLDRLVAVLAGASHIHAHRVDAGLGARL